MLKLNQGILEKGAMNRDQELLESEQIAKPDAIEALKLAAEKMRIAITTKLLDGPSEQWMTEGLREAYEDPLDPLEDISVE